MGITNKLTFNSSVDWLGSESLNSEYEIDIPMPKQNYGRRSIENKFLILIGNDSLESGLDIQAQVKWEDKDENIRYSTVDSWNVGMDSDESRIVQGILMGKGGRLVLSNDTDISSSFISYIQIRELV